ncbi:MAG: peptidoglycan DD-metalloendopeptidase family protein [Paracoccaceae bacterium]
MRAFSIAKALIGQPDLYTAMRDAAADGIAPLGDMMEAVAIHDPETARRLSLVDAGLLEAVMRAGAGLPAIAGAPALKAWLETAEAHPLFRPDPATSQTTALLTQGQRPDMPAFSDRAFDVWFADQGVPYGLGAYGEQRTVYETDQFADAASPERRTVHLGIDVFAAIGTPVYAPLPGRVLSVTYNADPLDYGHTLILQHDHGPQPFYTLYGHLGGSLPGLLVEGQSVAPGQLIAHLGDWHENGGWAAHLHFQVMSDMLRQSGNFFGVGHASLLDVWQDILIDANLILRIPAEKFQA